MAHDIFVSYAHADDMAAAGAKNGPVTTFVDELKKLLRMKMGGDGPGIWMDYQLAANERVTETLAEVVSQSRIFLLFMSPGYLKSPWCADEIEGFLGRNEALFHRENVFVVATEYTDRNAWPARVQQLSPIELYITERSGATRTLGWPSPPSDPDSDYWKRMNELGHAIRKHLERIESVQPGTRQPSLRIQTQGVVSQPVTLTTPVNLRDTHAAAVDVAAIQPKVWIGAGGQELTTYWESLASAVRQAGAIVIPASAGIYQALDDAALRRLVSKDLADADILLQMLSLDLTTEFGRAAARAAVLQHQMADFVVPELARKMKRWRVGPLPGEDADALVPDYLAILRGATEGAFEQFRSGVVADIRRLIDPPPAKPSFVVADGGGLNICVTAGKKDQSLVQDVVGVVAELGATPFAISPVPEEDQSAEEYRELMQTLLTESDGVILVHGEASPMWLASKHLQIKKVLDITGKPRSLWGALLDGPPPGKTQRYDCKDAGVLTLRCDNGDFKPSVQRFLSELLGSRAHV